jgi:hypothetical protein
MISSRIRARLQISAYMKGYSCSLLLRRWLKHYPNPLTWHSHLPGNQTLTLPGIYDKVLRGLLCGPY